LAKKYTRQRLDLACRILKEDGGNVTYKALESILKNKRDITEGTHIVSTIPHNPNVRGAEAFQYVATGRKEEDDGPK
jgi:hypothetical protein